MPLFEDPIMKISEMDSKAARIERLWKSLDAIKKPKRKPKKSEDGSEDDEDEVENEDKEKEDKEKDGEKKKKKKRKSKKNADKSEGKGQKNDDGTYSFEKDGIKMDNVKFDDPNMNIEDMIKINRGGTQSDDLQ